MKIAIPTANGRLTPHFGHCRQFAIVTVQNGSVESTEFAEPPPHEPGALPQWLHEQEVDLVIAGGMGHRAQAFFQQFGIDVVVGAPSDTPEAIAQAYLDDSLETGANLCDH